MFGAAAHKHLLWFLEQGSIPITLKHRIKVNKPHLIECILIDIALKCSLITYQLVMLQNYCTMKLYCSETISLISLASVITGQNKKKCFKFKHETKCAVGLDLGQVEFCNSKDCWIQTSFFQISETKQYGRSIYTSSAKLKDMYWNDKSVQGEAVSIHCSW